MFYAKSPHFRLFTGYLTDLTPLFKSLFSTLMCTRTHAFILARGNTHTHTHTHTHSLTHSLTPFSFQKPLVKQIDRLEWKWGGRSVTTSVRTRPFEKTSKLGSYHHGSCLGCKGLLFVFALVKQSPKHSASRDSRWDCTECVCMCVCVCVLCFPVVESATFTHAFRSALLSFPEWWFSLFLLVYICAALYK